MPPDRNSKGIPPDARGEYLAVKSDEGKGNRKLDAMKLNAVIPQQLKDYAGLELKGKSLFEDYKRIIRYYNECDIALINQKVNKDAWYTSTLETNAFYDAGNNSINILLGILGGEFYRDDMSEEELYSGIGMSSDMRSRMRLIRPAHSLTQRATMPTGGQMKTAQRLTHVPGS